MSTVRLRRLTADYTQLDDYIKRHPRLRLIQADGDPPESYQIEYRIRSLKQIGDEIAPTKSHIVEISLPRNYPRVPPQCRMLTPVFHPNIAPHAICVGDHWSAGESLKSIVIRIGEMLAYQSYNVKSPLNGEAARWVDEHEAELPLDHVSMLVEDPDPEETENETTERESNAPRSRPTREDIDPPESRPSGARPMASRPVVSRPASPSSDEVGEPRTIAADRPSSTAAAARPALPVDEDRSTAESAASTSDMISARCPHCSTVYRLPAKHVGRNAECRVCHNRFKLTDG